jgi:pilus assembly protein CpaF
MSISERLGRIDRPDRTTEVRDRVQVRLVESLGPKLYDAEMSEHALEDLVHSKLRELLDQEAVPLSTHEKASIIQQVGDSILGLGPLEPYVRDPNVTEIMVNGPDSIYIERAGKLYPTDARFVNDEQLRRTIDKIVARVGRRVDEASPYVDARLADGSRVNAIIPPLAIHGAAVTIRKFSADPYRAEDLIAFGTMDRTVASFLHSCVKGRINILVSGGTGAGKTTTLNVLSSFLPEDERIITIEDAAELRLQQPHVVSLEYRPPNIEGRGEVTIRDLVRNALRMRPDRIIVGEVRGGEALDMLQAMNTGHDGSISTIHANTPRDVLSRLETMTLMAGMDITIRAVREQISSAINLIVQQSRLQDGTRRITHVTEIVGMEGDIITLQDLFVFDIESTLDDQGAVRGKLRATGLRPHFLQKLADRQVKLDVNLFEPPPGMEPW